jgi:hypothetical protein
MSGTAISRSTHNHTEPYTAPFPCLLFVYTHLIGTNLYRNFVWQKRRSMTWECPGRRSLGRPTRPTWGWCGPPAASPSPDTAAPSRGTSQPARRSGLRPTQYTREAEISKKQRINLNPVLGIRIRMFLGLPDQDPLVRGTDPDPALDPLFLIKVLSGLKQCLQNKKF